MREVLKDTHSRYIWGQGLVADTPGCILNLMRFCWLCLVVLLALLLPWVAAQKSGGGAGGRSGFGSTPAPRVNPSPSPSIPLPTPRSSPSSPSAPILIFPNNNGSGEGDFDLAALVVLVVIAVIAYSMMSGLRRAAGGGGSGAPEAQVMRLRLAVLYSAALQRNLRQLAARADTQNTRGLADLIDDSAALLLREEPAWKFGSLDSWKGSLAQAEATFDQYVTEERSEYVETLRNFEGKTRTDSEYTPQLAPDGRYVLVSLVLAVRGGLDSVALPLRTASARQALLVLSGSTPLTTLASYLSWTPEADGEALTEEDLLLGWPRLELL